MSLQESYFDRISQGWNTDDSHQLPPARENSITDLGRSPFQNNSKKTLNKG